MAVKWKPEITVWVWVLKFWDWNWVLHVTEFFRHLRVLIHELPHAPKEGGGGRGGAERLGGGGEVGAGVGLDCLLRSEFDFLYLAEHIRTPKTCEFSAASRAHLHLRLNFEERIVLLVVVLVHLGIGGWGLGFRVWGDWCSVL